MIDTVGRGLPVVITTGAEWAKKTEASLNKMNS